MTIPSTLKCREANSNDGISASRSGIGYTVRVLGNGKQLLYRFNEIKNDNGSIGQMICGKPLGSIIFLLVKELAGVGQCMVRNTLDAQ